MKKFLIIAILGYLFFQGVLWFNEKMNEEFFDEYYGSDHETSETQDESDIGFLEELQKFFENLFQSEKKEERFIYR